MRKRGECMDILGAESTGTVELEGPGLRAQTERPSTFPPPKGQENSAASNYYI